MKKIIALMLCTGTFSMTSFAQYSYERNLEGRCVRSTQEVQSGNSGYSPTPPSTQNEVREIQVNGVKFKMIKVVGGSFSMGATAEQTGYDSDETPVYQVTLSDYYIAETEVTQGLWKAVMGDNPSYFQGGDNYPVESVSWNDCQDFIRKLNALTEGKRPEGTKFRLPTEAEWEYAARGGKYKEGYEYSGSDDIDRVARYYEDWYYEDWDIGSTHPVAKKGANALGIYDMSGNVWEWCIDWYGSYSAGAQYDPEGASSGSYRVVRGGSWNYGASGCRVAFRFSGLPERRYDDLGLRLACSRL